MLEPTTFPIDISKFRLIAAITEVVNSGKLVPIATTVSEIILSLTPIFVAKLTAPSTRKSEPKTRPPQLAIIISKETKG